MANNVTTDAVCSASLLTISDEQLDATEEHISVECKDALNADEKRRMEAEAAQPKPSPQASQEDRELMRAARILRAKGHKEVALVLEGKVPLEENIAAIEAAMQDREVPGGIRFQRIKPLLNSFDENEAVELLSCFMREVVEAARIVLGERFLPAGLAFQAQAALRRASGVRFEGCHMAAIERMLVDNRLPKQVCQPLADYRELAEAVPSALYAKPRTRAKAFLISLTNPLWDRVKPAIQKAEAARTRAKNPNSGFSGRYTGKTARTRAMKDTRRQD